MKYVQWLFWSWICLLPASYAVTVNLTDVPDYPQPAVPNLVETSSGSVAQEIETVQTPSPTPVEHTVYPIFVDKPPEYEESETIAFPPDSGSRVAAAESSTVVASLSLTCNPVEYGMPVTTTETVPIIAIIAAFDPPIAVKTSKTREDSHTAYAMGWLAPDPGFQNDLTIEGIDVDNDCVRDDIENYIYRQLPGPWNIAKRKYLFEYAKWLQAFIAQSNSLDDAFVIQDNASRASYCAEQTLGSNAKGLLEDVFIEMHETYARATRYYQRIGLLAGYHTRALGGGSCDF